VRAFYGNFYVIVILMWKKNSHYRILWVYKFCNRHYNLKYFDDISTDISILKLWQRPRTHVIQGIHNSFRNQLYIYIKVKTCPNLMPFIYSWITGNFYGYKSFQLKNLNFIFIDFFFKNYLKLKSQNEVWKIILY
jgi:hypothetical protein